MRSWLRKHAQEADRSLLILDRVTDWSALRRVTPYRTEFGRRRGKCIDRYYIERFLATYEAFIQGSVAEIGDDEYTRQFDMGKVVHSDILDVNDRNLRRSITIDLARTECAQESVYDCIICTQTIFQIFDYAATVRTLHKLLKPGGSLLATVPGISQTVREALLAGAGADWWRFTARSAKRIFGEVFGDENVILHTYGNVLTATAFLHGLVAQELTQAELDYHDPDYEVSIALKATKNPAT